MKEAWGPEGIAQESPHGQPDPLRGFIIIPVSEMDPDDYILKGADVWASNRSGWHWEPITHAGHSCSADYYRIPNENITRITSMNCTVKGDDGFAWWVVGFVNSGEAIDLPKRMGGKLRR